MFPRGTTTGSIWPDRGQRLKPPNRAMVPPEVGGVRVAPTVPGRRLALCWGQRIGLPSRVLKTVPKTSKNNGFRSSSRFPHSFSAFNAEGTSTLKTSCRAREELWLRRWSALQSATASCTYVAHAAAPGRGNLQNYAALACPHTQGRCGRQCGTKEVRRAQTGKCDLWCPFAERSAASQGMDDACRPAR